MSTRRAPEVTEVTYRLLKVGNEVVAVLILLQASERHLGTGDVLPDETGQPHENDVEYEYSCTHLLGVLEVLEESLLRPDDTLTDVSSSVGEALRLAGLAAENTRKKARHVSTDTLGPQTNVPMQVRADFVRLASTKGVALSTAGLEEGSTLCGVT